MNRMSTTACFAALCAIGAAPAVRAEDLAMCLRGWEATQAHDYARAIELYDRCLRDGRLGAASLARTYRNIGITYRQAGQPAKAIAAFDKAIALHPEDVADDYINRGNARDEAGDFNQALADYATALQIQPGDGEAYYNRGIAYERHRQLGAAQAEFVAAYNHGLRTDLLYERLLAYGLLKGAQQ